MIDLGPGLRDIGIGDDPTVKFSVSVVQPFVGGTSLQVAVQGSVDNSTYVTMASGPVIAEANLVAGCHLLDIDLPRIAGAQVIGAVRAKRCRGISGWRISTRARSARAVCLPARFSIAPTRASRTGRDSCAQLARAMILAGADPGFDGALCFLDAGSAGYRDG